MNRFRFQNLEIWQLAIEIGDKLFDIADELEKKHLYRFAEQTRGVGMSLSNNIAEGSGSEFDREFARFLNITRRSAFETANISIILHRRNLITEKVRDSLLDDLNHLCGRMTNFKKTLNL
jgi:four helix bundle protein